MFQFYDSPIKSIPIRLLKHYFFRFNSMIVRLKVKLIPHNGKPFGGFNSMIVRLKDRLNKFTPLVKQVSIL